MPKTRGKKRDFVLKFPSTARQRSRKLQGGGKVQGGPRPRKRLKSRRMRRK